MMTMRERFDELKNKNNIPSDADLLARIYYELQKTGDAKETDPGDFIENNKGSFSQMVKGERWFNPDYYLPLERILGAPLTYLIDGKTNTNYLRRHGIEHAACVDTDQAYDRVVAEGIYRQCDEYEKSIFDYMVEYRSANGFEYFARIDMLPFNRLGGVDYSSLPNGIYFNQSDLFRAFVDLARPETVLKYCDGFHFANASISHDLDEDHVLQDIDDACTCLIKKSPLRKTLCSFKAIPLMEVNPEKHLDDGLAMKQGYFSNIFHQRMLDNIYDMRLSNKHDIAEELVLAAYQVNAVIIKGIQDIGLSKFTVDDEGFVYAGGILCGNLITLRDPRTIYLCPHAYIELNHQVIGFIEKLTQTSSEDELE